MRLSISEKLHPNRNARWHKISTIYIFIGLTFRFLFLGFIYHIASNASISSFTKANLSSYCTDVKLHLVIILMLILWGATGFKYSEAKKSQVSENSPYYCGDWRHGDHLKLLSKPLCTKNNFIGWSLAFPITGQESHFLSWLQEWCQLDTLRYKW